MTDPRTVTFVVLIAAGAWIICAVAWLLLDAARNAGTARAVRTAHATIVVILLWATGACTFAAFAELSFPVFLPMVLVPIALGTWAILRPNLSELLAHARIEGLIAVQVYRVAGAIFLHLYYATGSLSWGFARNAGWGDVATGVLALPVAWMVWRRAPCASVSLVAWCVFGIGDLVVAPISAGLYGAERLVEFPINTVPMFLGPPLGIWLQIVVLRAWWLQRATFARADQRARAT